MDSLSSLRPPYIPRVVEEEEEEEEEEEAEKREKQEEEEKKNQEAFSRFPPYLSLSSLLLILLFSF